MDPDETLDVLFRRRMLLLQARKGYRCNADSLILAAHVSAWIRRAARGSEPSPKPKDETTETTPLKVADLGAGSGVIGLALALSDPRGTARVLAAERQPAMASRRGRTQRGAARLEIDRVSEVLGRSAAKVFAPNESREKSDAGTGAAPGVPANDAEDESSTRGGAGGDAGGGGRGGDSTRSSSSNETSSDDEAVHRVARAMFRGWLGACDAVVVNPPYHAREGSRAAGTPPATRERLEAHYETGAGLDEFAAAAARLLIVRRDSIPPSSRACSSLSSAAEGGGAAGDAPIPAAHFVYPANRAGRVVEACAKAGLDRVRTRLVFDAAGAEEPTLALVTAWRRRRRRNDDDGRGRGGGTGFAVVEESPPLVLYADAERKTYGEEIEAFMETLGLPPPDSRADFA